MIIVKCIYYIHAIMLMAKGIRFISWTDIVRDIVDVRPLRDTLHQRSGGRNTCPTHQPLHGDGQNAGVPMTEGIWPVINIPATVI
jgi:hypothetical protein